MCDKTLEEEGVHGNITVADFNLDLIPLNNDVISMETSDSLREVSLHTTPKDFKLSVCIRFHADFNFQCALLGDKTSLFYTAKGLMKMQLLYGAFPVIKGKGFAAKAVADMLEEMGNELGTDAVEVEPKFDELILIDREVSQFCHKPTAYTCAWSEYPDISSSPRRNC
jgi:hypothetical protein